jgi:purine-binding chemotaxis protein CheW
MSAATPATAETLRQRARELARVPLHATARLIELLEFRLADERYAVATRFVQEVHPFDKLTPLPGTPEFVLGVVNARGRILPVFDLKKLFDLPEQGLADMHQIVFVRVADVEIGILADLVVGVMRLDVAHLQPSLPTLTGIRAQYLEGVTAERLVVLDLPQILGDPKIIVATEPQL